MFLSWHRRTASVTKLSPGTYVSSRTTNHNKLRLMKEIRKHQAKEPVFRQATARVKATAITGRLRRRTRTFEGEKTELRPSGTPRERGRGAKERVVGAKAHARGARTLGALLHTRDAVATVATTRCSVFPEIGEASIAKVEGIPLAVVGATAAAAGPTRARAQGTANLRVIRRGGSGEEGATEMDRVGKEGEAGADGDQPGMEAPAPDASRKEAAGAEVKTGWMNRETTRLRSRCPAAGRW